MVLTLFFVYNAESGLFNALTDYAHKVLTPGTYPFSSRMPSYGGIETRLEWKQFITQLGIHVEFHLGKQFKKHHGADKDFPAVYLNIEGELKLLASSEDINKCASPKELRQLIESGLDNSLN